MSCWPFLLKFYPGSVSSFYISAEGVEEEKNFERVVCRSPSLSLSLSVCPSPSNGVMHHQCLNCNLSFLFEESCFSWDVFTQLVELDRALLIWDLGLYIAMSSCLRSASATL